jgi:type II secretory pathway pseudopilin PulG
LSAIGRWPSWDDASIPRDQRLRGYSVLELVFVVGLILTLTTVTVPNMLTELDDYRAAGAARYLSARLQRTRMEAVSRSCAVALRFNRSAAGRYEFAMYVDSNHNGVLAADIMRGADPALGPAESLADNFAGVEFGALSGLPSPEPGGTPPGDDPIRLGAGNSATFTASGTSTPGSLYVRSRTAQYVIRIFGETGKTRVLRFNTRTRQWEHL